MVEKCLTAEEVTAEFSSEKDGDKAESIGITSDLILNDNKGTTSISQHALLRGIIPDSQQIGLRNKGGTTNVNSGADTNIVGEDNGDTNLTIMGSMADTGLKAEWAPDCNGPSVLKTQAKWTRFNLMDFVLSGVTKALYLPTLGKRGVQLNKSTGLNTLQEEHNAKRGRFDSDNTDVNDTAVWVVDHPCREQ